MPSHNSSTFNPMRFVDPARADPHRSSPSRAAQVAELAYYFAQQRGFAPGHEVDDWLAAEAEVDRRLTGRLR